MLYEVITVRKQVLGARPWPPILAHRQGKKVELILQGEDTRVDKAVIDELGEPLVHLIRNAVDHGIESPTARVAAGKPETGHIRIDARREKDSIRNNFV